MNDFVKAHIMAIKNTPCFSGAEIIFIPEGNLATTHQHTSDAVLGIEGVGVACERQGAYGVKTGPHMKEKFVFRLQHLLKLDAISYHDGLISANPLSTSATYAVDTKNKFEGQLRNFRYYIRAPTSPGQELRGFYSGKFDADGKTYVSNDDLCMAILIGLFWSQHVISGAVNVRRRHQRLTVAGRKRTLQMAD